MIFLDARLETVQAADTLHPGRDVIVIPYGIVAAVRADDLKHAGVDALRLALDDATSLQRRSTIDWSSRDAMLAVMADSPQVRHSQGLPCWSSCAR